MGKKLRHRELVWGGGWEENVPGQGHSLRSPTCARRGLVGVVILGGFQKSNSLQIPPVLGEVPGAGLRHGYPFSRERQAPGPQ